jgi:hypothetical protein
MRPIFKTTLIIQSERGWMQQKDLSLDTEHTGWVTSGRMPEQPWFVVEYDGNRSAFVERFRQPGAGLYAGSDLDFFYRYQPSDHALSGGVFAVSDRITGDLLLEIAVSPGRIEQFMSAIRQYVGLTENNPTYRVKLCTETQIADFEKEVFLVYGADGELIRQRSLIPDWIEM